MPMNWTEPEPKKLTRLISTDLEFYREERDRKEQQEINECDDCD